MSAQHWYRAHGLAIRSAVELPLPPAPPAAGPPDLVLRRGADRPVPSRRPDGERLAELAGPGGRLFYSLGRDLEGATLRYPGLCDFTGDRGLAAVTCHLHPGTDPGLLAVLAAGTLLAVHLTLRRELVLHASAVQVDGHALAFVGGSGMGKSTLAAALCATVAGTGCGLVADDVLRVERTKAGAMLVHPGSTESRLRPSAGDLAAAAAPGAARPTADGRLALRPPLRAEAPLPLVACVLPRPSRDASEVSVRRMSPARALLRIAQFPRVAGWRERESADRAFQRLADLVELVPVFEATVPWGPPFRPRVLAELLAAVDAAPAGQR
ncbi:MAG TPA: hypothetical protein VFM37_15215 [Pseudonocardiaceae bacterium]|nr:hypothetical protein [Pseudonocardiaceae bacterium]